MACADVDLQPERAAEITCHTSVVEQCIAVSGRARVRLVAHVLAAPAQEGEGLDVEVWLCICTTLLVNDRTFDLIVLHR